MTSFVHLDEARRSAVEALLDLLEREAKPSRAVLVDDLFGELRVALLPGPDTDAADLVKRIDDALRTCAAGAWTGVTWVMGDKSSNADRLVINAAWDEGVPHSDRLRVLDRVRNRSAWFQPPQEPLWRLGSEPGAENPGPPILAFCSFKGGVGRTTGLASFAMARAAAGERVVVIDFDLDAPGVATLLSPDGPMANWGVVDYLLERARGAVPLADYISHVAPDLTSPGSIEVMAAGTVNHEYLAKLARIDLEVAAHDSRNPLGDLLEDLRSDRNPDWILIDTRAGLSPAAGLLLSGIAHLYVVFATGSSQSEAGLERLATRLGADRLRADPPKGQSGLVVVHAMVPEDARAFEAAEREFDDRLETILASSYFAADDDDSSDDVWTVGDVDTAEWPGHSIPIPYAARLANLRSIRDVASLLLEGAPYRKLHSRIEGLVPRRASETVDEEAES